MLPDPCPSSATAPQLPSSLPPRNLGPLSPVSPVPAFERSSLPPALLFFFFFNCYSFWFSRRPSLPLPITISTAYSIVFCCFAVLHSSAPGFHASVDHPTPDTTFQSPPYLALFHTQPEPSCFVSSACLARLPVRGVSREKKKKRCARTKDQKHKTASAQRAQLSLTASHHSKHLDIAANTSLVVAS